MVAITRKRGDTYADEITVKSKATGLPINITGYTFKLTVDPKKDPLTADNNLFSITGTILNPIAGTVEFAPSEPQSDQVPGTYYYDIEMIDGAGRVRTIELDKYVFTQDITKT